MVNHLQHSNPYQSNYKDQWLEEMQKGAFLKNVVCVTELIDHIYSESAALMKGTKYENNFYFYHDALSQMTDKASIDYMEKNVF